MATRAIYLDLALSLSTDPFLLVFCRFVGIYGKPAPVHSNNVSNFVGAECFGSRCSNCTTPRKWPTSCVAQLLNGRSSQLGLRIFGGALIWFSNFFQSSSFCLYRSTVSCCVSVFLCRALCSIGCVVSSTM